jgi:DNA-directed RNA polymerase subunit K/omega
MEVPSPTKQSDKLNKYQLAQLVGARAKQLSSEHPYIPVAKTEYDPVKVAQKELAQGQLTK